MERIRLKDKPDGSKEVWLTLPGKRYKKRRNIGTIHNGTLYIFRNEPSHLYREVQGFGIAHMLLRNFRELYSRVVIVSGATVYECDRDYILDVGLYRSYPGLETQVFISVTDFEKEKIEKWETERMRLSRMNEARQMQCSLF